MLKKFVLPLLIILYAYCLAGATEQGKGIRAKYIKSGISDRNLLGVAPSFLRTQPASVKKIPSPKPFPQRLKLLAIRVEFQKDGNSLTTGDGTFDLSPNKEVALDPPPHDRNYFENQLKALANYYKSVSQGKLILEGEVFPEAPQAAYTLPHPIAYYNPGGSEELLDQRLAELFRDAWVAADTSDTLNFSQYDCFIIFHAGVGLEFSPELDPTPNDIPSVFLDFQHFQKTIGKDEPDFRGIPVMEETYFIRDGIILPETESQEGYEFGLLGTAALMFGHQLGLPNLFDTDSGRPGIGRWGLMDQGSANFKGFLPAQPCAWSKVFLGWEEPIEVKKTTSALKVAASLAKNKNKIYKIPVNSREYFLIENRQQDANKDKIALGRDARGTRVEFKSDGTILAQDTIGVIVRVDEYDFDLPGSGILIWHIDENVIGTRYTENRVNTDMNHRGVDLEEADGAQDIGYYYEFFGFGGYDTGNPDDAFWKNNQSHKEMNESNTVSFTPTSAPNSRTNSRANSHIFITNFSDIDSVMTFDLTVDIYQPGFPQFFGSPLGSNAIACGDIDGDGQNELVAAAQMGTLFAWNHDGSKVIANSDSSFSISVNNDTTWYSVALFAMTKSTISSSPALGDLDGDGKLEVIVSTYDGKLIAWRATDEDGDGRADTLFTFNSGTVEPTSPVVVNLDGYMPGEQAVIGNRNGDVIAIGANGQEIWRRNLGVGAISGIAGYGWNSPDSLCVTSLNGTIFLLDNEGETIWSKTLSYSGVPRYPVVGDLTHDGNLDIMVIWGMGTVVVLNKTGEIIPGFEAMEVDRSLSPPALADVDGDGFLEIVAATSSQIFAFNHNGTLTDNFPIDLPLRRSGSPTVQSEAEGGCTSPILADLEGDGKTEIVVAGTLYQQFMAYHSTGNQVSGFPLSIGGVITAPPVMMELDGDDNNIELAAGCNDGFLYVWNLDWNYESQNISWGSFLHDAQRSGRTLERRQTPGPGGELMPPSLVYNYPNPTQDNTTTIRYRLNYAATVKIRIYDLAGELVDEFTGPGLPQTDNEVVWNLEGIESGVYLARVEAVGEAQKSVSFFKIAVVK